MFGTQAMRLRRTDWMGPEGAKLLSQELYAMFQEDIPLTHAGGLTLSAPGTEAPLTIDRPDFSDGKAISFGAGTPGGGVSFEGGKVVITGPQLILRTDAGDFNPADPAAKKKDEKPSASTYPGVVVSGSGQSYQVDIFTQGLSGPAARVKATAPNLSDDATLESGEAFPVSAVSTASGAVLYYFYPPCWGPDLA